MFSFLPQSIIVLSFGSIFIEVQRFSKNKKVYNSFFKSDFATVTSDIPFVLYQFSSSCEHGKFYPLSNVIKIYVTVVSVRTPATNAPRDCFLIGKRINEMVTYSETTE